MNDYLKIKKKYIFLELFIIYNKENTDYNVKN